MNRHTLFFTGPHQVEVRPEALSAPLAGEALVRTLCSAISPGTELLIYRGQFPTDLAVDETISALAGRFAYPLRYGYSAVGEVVEVGPGVDSAWLGRRVFAFQPHTEAFVAPVADLHPLPPGLTPETALFLPNMETAVNFLLDGHPRIGEAVVVFGQGVVGLLTTALLARLPLERLITLDCLPLRRAWSCRLGAHFSLDPGQPEALTEARGHLRPAPEQAAWQAGADLVYELTGAPATLDQAITAAGFGGRIVVGSWYGQKRAAVDLGGRFHRARLTLISSQVSTLTPTLHARWTKARRLDVAWRMLAELDPARLITHHFSLPEAAQAYRLLDQAPGEALQVVLTYP